MNLTNEAGEEAVAIGRVKLCMQLFIASESFFFVLLILTYVYYHGAITTGPNAKRDLDPLKTGFFTTLLILSSATIWLSGRALRKNKDRSFYAWLAATILLGLAFLAGQGLEYSHLLHDHVTISRNLFGTTFFTLTGMHGLHVIIGLILLGITFLLSLSGQRGKRHRENVESVSLYWHFVDAVWIVVFSVIYLWSAS